MFCAEKPLLCNIFFALTSFNMFSIVRNCNSFTATMTETATFRIAFFPILLMTKTMTFLLLLFQRVFTLDDMGFIHSYANLLSAMRALSATWHTMSHLHTNGMAITATKIRIIFLFKTMSHTHNLFSFLFLPKEYTTQIKNQILLKTGEKTRGE